MAKANDLHWINLRADQIKKEYFAFLNSKNLDNTFDNCNDFLSLKYSTNISKNEFGVSSRVELAKIVSNKDPDLFSL